MIQRHRRRSRRIRPAGAGFFTEHGVRRKPGGDQLSKRLLGGDVGRGHQIDRALFLDLRILSK